MADPAATSRRTEQPRPERLELAPGLEISRVLTGLWQIADMEREGTTVDPQAGAAAMERYVDAGLTTFDMADHYGSAELIVGTYQATRGTTKPIEALTKWVPKPGPVSRADVRTAVYTALDRLRMDRLDLMQFHTWAYDDPSWLDALFYLQELKQQGLIGALGVTNFDTAHLRMALSTGLEVSSNQVSFSLLDRRAQANGMTELCREHGIHLLAYGTVAGGLLTERWLDRPEPTWDESTSWSLNKYRRFVEATGGWQRFQELLRTVAEVARRHGVSMANVATRAVLDTRGVGGVIIGARLGRSEHVDDTTRVFELRLDEQDQRQLEQATSRIGPVPGDCGDEYRTPPYLTASGDLSHHLEDLPAPYASELLPGGRRVVSTGTRWEEAAGYSRAVLTGNRILVSGTTAIHGGRVIGGSDAGAQTHFVLDKIQGALRTLGASLDAVVRTRIFVSDIDDVEEVALAHGRRLGHVRPANTLVGADIAGDGQLVEIEAEAVLD